VVGGISFLNHACDRHSNMWPAVWVEGDNNDVGVGRWQVATAKREVKGCEELYLFYAKYDAEEEAENVWPCPVCARK